MQAVHLFDHITDMDPKHIHIPDGSISESEVLRCVQYPVERLSCQISSDHTIDYYPYMSSRHCKEYEDAIQEAGGIDLQLLGLGRMGHIGFNEQGCAPNGSLNFSPLESLILLEDACTC